MACIDAAGKITRSAELILMAMIEPATVEEVSEECGLPLFRVRSAVRELVKAGLIEKKMENHYQTTSQGMRSLEDETFQVSG
jgi:predicted transcriptional regulator